MFNRTPDDNPGLNDAINQALKHLENSEFTDEEYAKTLTILERLYKLKTPRPPALSQDTMVTVGAHLLGILMIVGHERAHLVTSKALGFVQKLR